MIKDGLEVRVCIIHQAGKCIVRAAIDNQQSAIRLHSFASAPVNQTKNKESGRYRAADRVLIGHSSVPG